LSNSRLQNIKYFFLHNSRFHKIFVFSLISLIILTISIFAIRFVTEPSVVPENVRLTNLTDQSFNLSWTTKDTVTTGAVYVLQNSNFDPILSRFSAKKYYDTRDDLQANWYGEYTRQKLFTHYVEVNGLTPETKYTFRIETGNFLYDVSNQLGSDTVSTYITPETNTSPSPIYGRIMRADEINPQMGALVYLTLKNDTDKYSNQVSTVTNYNGSYTLDLTNIKDGSGAIFPTDTKTNLLFEVDSGNRGKLTYQQLNTATDPLIDLSLKSEVVDKNANLSFGDIVNKSLNPLALDMQNLVNGTNAESLISSPKIFDDINSLPEIRILKIILFPILLLIFTIFLVTTSKKLLKIYFSYLAKGVAFVAILFFIIQIFLVIPSSFESQNTKVVGPVNAESCGADGKSVCNAQGQCIVNCANFNAPTSKASSAATTQAPECTSGSQCNGKTVQNCSGGKWINGEVCDGTTRKCDGGKCVDTNPAPAPATSTASPATAAPSTYSCGVAGSRCGRGGTCTPNGCVGETPIPDCSAGQTRCDGKTVQNCQNGKWNNFQFCDGTSQRCANGSCTGTNTCVDETVNMGCEITNGIYTGKYQVNHKKADCSASVETITDTSKCPVSVTGYAKVCEATKKIGECIAGTPRRKNYDVKPDCSVVERIENDSSCLNTSYSPAPKEQTESQQGAKKVTASLAKISKTDLDNANTQTNTSVSGSCTITDLGKKFDVGGSCYQCVQIGVSAMKLSDTSCNTSNSSGSSTQFCGTDISSGHAFSKNGKCYKCFSPGSVASEVDCSASLGNTASEASLNACLIKNNGDVTKCKDVQTEVAVTASTYWDSYVDKDNDGFPASVDCNDNDPSIHPGATETAYDWKDSNCDGYDSPKGNFSASDLASCEAGKFENIDAPCVYRSCINKKWVVMVRNFDQCKSVDVTKYKSYGDQLSSYSGNGTAYPNLSPEVRSSLCNSPIKPSPFWIDSLDPLMKGCNAFAYCDGTQMKIETERGNCINNTSFSGNVNCSYYTKADCSDISGCQVMGNKCMNSGETNPLCNSKTAGMIYQDKLCKQTGASSYSLVPIPGSIAKCDYGSYRQISEPPPENASGYNIKICTQRCEKTDSGGTNWVDSICKIKNYNSDPNLVDKDGDGYYSTNVDGLGLVDCNDNDPSVYPGAVERLDGKDNNCNGQVDELFVTKNLPNLNDLAALTTYLANTPCVSGTWSCPSTIFHLDTYESSVAVDKSVGSLYCNGGKYTQTTSEQNHCNPNIDTYYRESWKAINTNEMMTTLKEDTLFRCKRYGEITNGACNCNLDNKLNFYSNGYTSAEIDAYLCSQSITKNNKNLFDNCSTALYGSCSSDGSKRCNGRDSLGNDMWINDNICDLNRTVDIPLDPTILANSEDLASAEKSCDGIVKFHNSASQAWTKTQLDSVISGCRTILLAGGKEKYFKENSLDLFTEINSEAGYKANANEERMVFNSPSSYNYMQIYELFIHEATHSIDVREDLVWSEENKDWFATTGWTKVDKNICTVCPPLEALQTACVQTCSITKVYENPCKQDNRTWELAHPELCKNSKSQMIPSNSTNSASHYQYATPWPSEDYAESAKFFLTNNDALAASSPDRCKYMKDKEFADSDLLKNSATSACFDCNPNTQIPGGCSNENLNKIISPNNIISKTSFLNQNFQSTVLASGAVNAESFHNNKMLLAKIKIESGNDTIIKYPGMNLNFVGYYDVNGNGKMDPDERILENENLDYSNLKVSYIFNYQLSQGWQTFSPVVNPGDSYTASSLLKDIAKQGGYATDVSTYKNGKWSTYKIRGSEIYSDEDFKIEMGKGYFIKIQKELNFEFAGIPSETSAKVDISNGWNLIGINPGFTKDSNQNWNFQTDKLVYSADEGKSEVSSKLTGDSNNVTLGYSAFELISSMNNSGLQSKIVTKWDSGRYTNAITDKDSSGKPIDYGADFYIDPQKAYFVRVDKNSVSYFTP